MLGLGFQLRFAIPGWVVGVCLSLLARSACTPPLLAGVCGVGVCAWARVSAAPRQSWLGCRGVFVFVGAPRSYPATPGWGDAFPWGSLATGRCGGHAQASRQAKHCAQKGILMVWSCDKAFQDPCHSETREREYVQQHIRYMYTWG